MKYFSFLILAIGVLTGTTARADHVTLRDKIGQMFIMGFEGKEVDSNSSIIKSIEDNNIGGVILFDYNSETRVFDKNIESREQVQKLNSNLQQFNHLANVKHNRPQLPLLISVDYEGGRVNRLKEEYGFPKTLSAVEVSRLNMDEANNVAHTMSSTLKDVGFNLDFAPILDVNVNPNNPVIGKLDRSFSDNPSVVANYGHIYSANFLQQGVQCAYKHFPGHGSSNADSHLGFVDVTETWQEYELEPYQQLLGNDNACGMVMTAHIVNRQLDESGLPATLSHKILTGILRDKLKYNGVIITDDMQMNAISDYYGLEHSLTLAINAGADMFIFGNQLGHKKQDPKELVDIVEAKVKSGEISESRINDAYQHIVTLKQTIS